ncbi:heterokaryon incompatibility protein-domain-containing protein, partial [Trametes meyenii]
MKPQASGSPLPTRVIDCANPSAPRLVVSETLGETLVPYVALSYVWGKNASHCTYQENYETYLEGIDYDVIPQTIRDAIRTTHNLGMRYIWIDAFCIIQNCEEDKKEELAKMGGIYQNAYFTLIASSAPSGDAGFLQDRALPPHYRIPYYRSDGGLGSVCVGRRGNTVPAVVPGKEPVDRRAWCFQEWLLSPRKLLYTSDTLRYHCQTTARPVEDSIRAIRTVQSAVLDHAFLPLERAILANPDLAELSPDEHFARQCMLWGLIVSNYTQRQLSVKTDRLLAFMAIAERFDAIWQPERHPGRYIAGLWEKFLPRDLLWYRELAGHAWQDDSLRPRPAEYLAPSWAWSSLDAHVVTRAGAAYDGGLQDACEVLRCNVTLVDKGLPYGRVSAGHLKLSA